MDILNKVCISHNKIKELNPLIHHITNYVTVNDCANITLSIGGSPVMADDVEEVKEMTSVSQALVINIGTLNTRTISSMNLAITTANKLNIPVILDPVGVGATKLRTKTAKDLVTKFKFSVIRGNLSEIKTLYGLSSKTKDVDTIESTLEDNILKEGINIAKNFSKECGAVIAITGAKDIISNGEDVVIIDNGHSIMGKVTGTGCMCSSLIGCFLGGNNDSFTSAIGGVLSMGIAGEKSYECLNHNEGTGTFKVKLMDNIYNLNKTDFLERGKINVILGN